MKLIVKIGAVTNDETKEAKSLGIDIISVADLEVKILNELK